MTWTSTIVAAERWGERVAIDSRQISDENPTG
jgi:hypothetical protein